MKILNKPKATVGQIVKDLEKIVAKSPKIFLEFSNDDGNGMFVEGIKLRKDIAILETTGNKKRAATVEDLLAMFRMLNVSLGVVLQDGWEMKGFEPFGDGSIFIYDEDDNYCQFMVDRDVRLITTQQIEAELKNIENEGFFDFTVVAKIWHGDCGTGHIMNCVQRRYGKLCLCYDKDVEADGITVRELWEEFPTCAEFMVYVNGKYYTVYEDENERFRTSELMTRKMKFLSIRLGEVVYDPKEKVEFM